MFFGLFVWAQASAKTLECCLGRVGNSSWLASDSVGLQRGEKRWSQSDPLGVLSPDPQTSLFDLVNGAAVSRQGDSHFLCFLEVAAGPCVLGHMLAAVETKLLPGGLQ